jgi:hypothetical protein
MHFDGALSEGGGALHGLDFIDIRIDERLVREIDAAEFETVALGRGSERERDLFSGVE